MKALGRVMRAMGDVTQEQRVRVTEALQGALQDGSLEVEFAIKEKNRRLLVLEEERREMKDEMATRDAVIVQLRQQLEREAKALALMKEGAIAQVKELIEQRKSLQQRLMQFELGAPSDSPAAPGLRDSLERAHRDAAELPCRRRAHVRRPAGLV